MDNALELAIAEVEQLTDNSGVDSNKRILVVSDFQKSSRIAGLAGREWPEDCILELETIQGQVAGNTGLRWLGWTGDESAKQRLRSHTDRARELGLFGAPSFVIGTELFWGNDRLGDAIACAATGGLG